MIYSNNEDPYLLRTSNFAGDEFNEYTNVVEEVLKQYAKSRLEQEHGAY